MIFFGSKDIKVKIKNFVEEESHLFNGKTVIDLPAGSGETSKLLINAGANVIPYDLFPEFFKLNNMKCNYCDLNEEYLPIPAKSVDVIFCQEGIEHIPDQLKLFKNFNRSLKPNGILYLTTPNLSNLKSKISFLLHESEYYYKIMPPNEIDSIWFGKENKLYFGHVFLINIYKIRLLSKVSGFKINRIIPTKVNYSSLFLFIFLYPFIVFISVAGFLRAIKKNKGKNLNVFKEIFKINLNINVLLGNHLFLELEKEIEEKEAINLLRLAEGKKILNT